VSTVNMSVPKSKFEGNFCTYVFGTFASLKVIVAHRVIYWKKILNYFGCVEVRILVEK